ncbi:MAG: peroxiredoxin [Rubrimonas sp.]|uniref:peroxiredoxin n=1 Tax=Rubrimonas sp. TaxID=2036015 RepID=UPI002FDD8C8F
MTITVGAALPAATFKTKDADGLRDVPSSEVFGAGDVALFAVPGAYTPTCHLKHMPSFVNNVAALKAKGVARIVCVSVNDPFVMEAWGEATGASAAGVTMLADPDAAFTKALGLDFDGSGAGLGVRSKRYSMLVHDGAVQVLNVEASPGEATCSTGDALLDQI